MATKRQHMARSQTTARLVALATGLWLVSPWPLSAQTASTTDQSSLDVRTSMPTETDLDASERARATVWALDQAEWRRYRALMQGVRGSVSPATLSPVEVLGIHARDAAERQKYAEQWARLMREDAERILAFQQAYDEAQHRLFPQSQLIDALQVAMRPSKSTRDRELSLAKTDRVLFFTATDCGTCDAVLDRLLAKLPTVAGLDLYLLDVAVGEEHRIRQWAQTRKIDPLWVKERRITLNVDGGALKKLAATTVGGRDSPPVVLRRRGDTVSPLSLARF